MITFDNTIPGYCPIETMYAIGWLAKNLPPNSTVVEIGVFWGRLTNSIISNRSQGTKVICVDTCQSADFILRKYFLNDHRFLNKPGFSTDSIAFDRQTMNNDEWIKKYVIDNSLKLDLLKIIAQSSPIDNVEAWQKSSRDIIIDFPVELAIIDGQHRDGNSIMDLELFVNQPNCLIVFDDWDMTRFPEVCEAVHVAHFKYERAIYIPPNHKYVFALPRSGPMVSVAKKFMDIMTDGIWKECLNRLNNE